MIEIAVDQDKKRLYLVIDGTSHRDDHDTSVLPVGLTGAGDGVGLVIQPPSHKASELLLQHRFSEFPKEPLTLEFRHQDAATEIVTRIQDDNEIYHTVTVYRTNNGRWYLSFDIGFDTKNWKRMWSITEYEIAFDGIVKEQNLLSEMPSAERVAALPYDPSPHRHNVLLPLTDSSATLEQEIRGRSELLKKLHELTRSSLQARLESESVVARFEFPEEAKIACEQYLLYFAQFLKDVGIEVTAEVQQEAGQVLFAVTPKNKNEALAKIRTALHLYLHIPFTQLDGSETDVTTQRLASNVYHLKSQLALANAVLQAKDATIQAQHVTLVQQQHLLTSSLVSDPLVNNSLSQKGDTEDILDGLAQLTRYEGKGFNIHLPEIFRRLREFFRQD